MAYSPSIQPHSTRSVLSVVCVERPSPKIRVYSGTSTLSMEQQEPRSAKCTVWGPMRQFPCHNFTICLSLGIALCTPSRRLILSPYTLILRGLYHLGGNTKPHGQKRTLALDRRRTGPGRALRGAVGEMLGKSGWGKREKGVCQAYSVCLLHG